MQIDIIGEIIAREGGFVDRPDDRGGPTKFGVTTQTLSQWRRRQCTKCDVENLTEPEARQILTELFFIHPEFNTISDADIRRLVVDWGVNSGIAPPIKALQTAVSVLVDGVLGPLTICAVNNANPSLLFRNVFAARLKFIGHLISRDPSQAAFAEGWLTRMGALLF